MTTITSKGGLAIAEIVFFSPALLISIFIVLRHGFSRQMGWFYLVVLSLLRLIGSSALLYSETQQDYSSGLLETIYITSAVGTAPLLLALLGFLNRVHDGMKVAGANLPDVLFRGLQLLSLLALILAIVGGTKTTMSASGPTLSSTGHDLMKAAAILFLVMYLALAGITILTFTRKSSALSGERKLVDAGLAALPFLLVRIVYTVCVAFDTAPSSVFFFGSPNVYVEAFMQFLMEAIVVVIFIVAGLMTPKAENRGPRDIEPGMSQQKPDDVPMMNTPHHSGAPHRSGAPRPARNLGDYRPSRMIRNAISGR